MSASETNKLGCVGADGVRREFIWRADKAQLDDKWTFRVESQTSNPPGDCFELVVELLEERDHTARVVMMHHHGRPEYQAKGIPDALLPEIRRYLDKNVESSPRIACMNGVYRTPAATKVWERLKRAGLAEYDSSRDVYFLL